jgi:Arc/MetJ family transcription regulator
MQPNNGRRTNAQIDADKLREAAEVLRAYGVAIASANVCDVVANSIEVGTRKRMVRA